MGPNCGWLRETWSSRSFSRWTSQRRSQTTMARPNSGRLSLPAFLADPAAASLRGGTVAVGSPKRHARHGRRRRAWRTASGSMAVAPLRRALHSCRRRRCAQAPSQWLAGQDVFIAPSPARPIAGARAAIFAAQGSDAAARSSPWALRYWRKVSRVSGPIRLLRPALRNIAPPRRSRGTRGAGFGPMPQRCPSQPGEGARSLLQRKGMVVLEGQISSSGESTRPRLPEFWPKARRSCLNRGVAPQFGYVAGVWNRPRRIGGP